MPSGPRAQQDRRLQRLTDICTALPDVTRDYEDRHATFRVRKKVFAYYLVDHRGDEGIVGLVCKARPGENKALVESDPEHFYMPAYVGPRGWMGMRLDMPGVEWDEVEEFVVESYLMTAPKRLAALVKAAGPELRPI